MNIIVKKVDTSLLFMLILRCFVGTGFLTEKVFCIISIIYFALLVCLDRFTLKNPYVIGLKTYILVVVLSTIVGITHFPIRDVFRDLFYILPSPIWIYIGYRQYHKDPNKDIFCTLFIYGGVIAFKNYVLYMSSMSFSFSALRGSFSNNVYDIGFILPISIYYLMFLKKTIIKREIDIIITIAMASNIVLSLGRISIMQPSCMIIIIMICSMFTNRSASNIKKIVKIMLAILLFAIVFIKLMPEDVLSVFLEKLGKSLSEITISQDITSTSLAMNNWRAYEMQAALDTLKNGTIFDWIFGYGIGKGIIILYIPYNWENVVSNNSIPILHNGLYTILVKCGIVGVFSLLAIVVGNAVCALRLLKNPKLRECATIIIGISVGVLLNMWVVRGLVQQVPLLSFTLLLGWNCSYIRNYLTGNKFSNNR